MTKQFTALILGLMLAAVCLPLAAQTYSFQSFSYPNLQYARVLGINNRGAVVGGGWYYNKASGKWTQFGFKRDANGVLERPFAAASPTPYSTLATGITDHGLIVGQYTQGGHTTGFLLYHGVFTYYNVQPGWNTSITGINNRGDFVGVASNGQSSYGFVNSNGVVTKIQCPNNSNPGYPSGIAADGTVIGNCGNYLGVGFIRGPAGRYKIIKAPGGGDAIMYGINNLAHAVVGGYPDHWGQWHGFVYDYITDVMTTVDYGSSIDNTVITGINSKGVIVGFGAGTCFIGTPQ